MFPALLATNSPSIVWFQDISDDQTIKKIDGAIMGNESVGIALKRFNCYRVSVLDMPECEAKKLYTKELPAFYFFDPSAKLVQKVTGKRATSLSSVNKLIEYTWDKSFTQPIKKFAKEYKSILDRLDKYDVQRQSVEKDRAKLDEKPNQAAEKKVKAEEEALAEVRKAIEADEAAILTACQLKPEYLPEGTADSR
jgi:anion-transporting  ArsA/GET3 family ATPase